MSNWLDEALLDLQIYKLKRVGRRMLSSEEMWRMWVYEKM